MNRIAFELPDVGLREVRGMAYVEHGFLVLKINTSLLGMVDSESDVVKIEPEALNDVYIRKGLFRDRLVIEPKRTDLLDLVPGEHRVALELRVRRKYRHDLGRLVDECDELLWRKSR